jgi:hypothetical protein
MAIPVILCGQTTQIAAGVIQALKPEYEGEFASTISLHRNNNESVHPRTLN